MDTPLASGFLVDDVAMAAVVLWHSGCFDTMQIAALLHVREDAVCRTIHLARNDARTVPQAVRRP